MPSAKLKMQVERGLFWEEAHVSWVGNLQGLVPLLKRPSQILLPIPRLLIVPYRGGPGRLTFVQELQCGSLQYPASVH